MASSEDVRAIAERIAAFSAVQIKNAETFRNALGQTPTDHNKPDSDQNPSDQFPGPQDDGHRL